MQDMSSFDKLKSIFLRRKHKLFRALAQSSPSRDASPDLVHTDVVRLYEMVLNKQNQASQLDYFIKHELRSDLSSIILSIMDLLWRLLNFRTGSLISFVAYRICRKYPQSFWTILDFILQKMTDKQAKTSQQVIFLTDLYLYGFSVTVEEFMDNIFPSFKQHILQLLPKYAQFFEDSDFFAVKYQKMFNQQFHAWMQEQKLKIQNNYRTLLEKSLLVQENLIKQVQNQQQELEYIENLEIYETQLYRFSHSMSFLNQQFKNDQLRLKSIFQLKKQCKTFKLSFQYSEYQRSLYLPSNALKGLKPLKKSEMIRIQQSEALVTRIKLASNIKECIDLTGYFLQQVNTQSNREELIEIIINDCYNYNNISYVLKIILEITCFEPTLRDYCCAKGRKICAQSRMNLKYQKLLCEMCRFGLMDENILLDYCDKILKLENNQVTKEIESILQNLGTMIYYRSLSTHTRINALFERIQNMIKSKLVHFNIEHLFHLKGLLNYLRNHSNKISIVETQQMAQLEIKTNFQFIFKKMQKLVKENQFKKIIDFVAAGIDQQDFLSSYYYASLIKDLNQKNINIQIHDQTINTIHDRMKELDAQRSICWSRFLGELYNYQIVSRKKLVQNLSALLQQYQTPATLSSCLKCICACLETSKQYLKQSQITRDKKEVITLLLDIKKIICLNPIDQLLKDQIFEITEFFHPYLSHFQSLEEIYDLVVLAEQLQYHYNIYTLLDLLQNGTNLEQLKKQQKNESKKKYQEKEKSLTEKKWIEKPVKQWVEKPTRYRQKEQQLSQRNQRQTQGESPSKQSIRTDETRQGREVAVVQKKQIKVMGRGKGDKRIRVVTATYIDPTGEY